jgi:hypothetical protein
MRCVCIHQLRAAVVARVLVPCVSVSAGGAEIWMKLVRGETQVKGNWRRRVRSAVGGEGSREAREPYVCPAMLGGDAVGVRWRRRRYQGHIVSRVKVMVES